MLSGLEIVEQMCLGKIAINPWDESCLNPNSVDLHLSDTLMVYTNRTLDPLGSNPSSEFKIDPTGFILFPNNLYLGSTMEWTETEPPFVPCIEGKSSLARLGLSVHLTAGFGDSGFKGRWTLELFVVQPFVIYPGMRICQIHYTRLEGAVTPYRGKYQNQQGTVAYLPDNGEMK